MLEDASVLQLGLEIFAQLGHEHASARELARRLGVSHNFIHDRYGSKAAFWRAVPDHAMGARLEELPRAEGEADDAEWLWQAIAGFYLAAVDKPLIGRVFLFLDESSQDAERLIASGRSAPVPMHVLFFAVIPPGSGMGEGPQARCLGRTEPASPHLLTASSWSTDSSRRAHRPVPESGPGRSGVRGRAGSMTSP